MNPVNKSFLFFNYKIKKLFGDKSNLKYFIFTFIAYYLGYYSLIRANVYYLDDHLRILDRNVSWTDFSRYSTDFLAKVFNLNLNELVTHDISPLTQFIAIAFLSLTSLILVRLFKIKNIYSGLLATTILGLSPFYLQNMSFKMDAPYMALAMLSAVFSFWFIRNRIAFFSVGLLSLLLMYTTYQAANAVFILLTIFLVLDQVIKNQSIKLATHKSIKLILLCLSVFIVSTLIFNFVIVQKQTDYGYTSTSILEFRYLFFGIYNNITNYLNIIYSNFDKTLLGKSSVFLIVLFPIFIGVKRKSLFYFFLSIAILLLAALLSFGAYLVLEKPSFESRSFYGIGMFFSALFLLYIKYSTGIFNKISKIFLSWFMYNLIFISYCYGNALLNQSIYNDFRANLVIADLNIPELKNINDYEIYFDSEQLIAPRTKIAREEFPILNLLVTEGNQRYIWSTSRYNYWAKWGYKITGRNCVSNDSKLKRTIDTSMHKIDIYDNCIIVKYTK